jgi:hypothetical protein
MRHFQFLAPLSDISRPGWSLLSWGPPSLSHKYKTRQKWLTVTNTKLLHYGITPVKCLYEWAQVSKQTLRLETAQIFEAKIRKKNLKGKNRNKYEISTKEAFSTQQQRIYNLQILKD